MLFVVDNPEPPLALSYAQSLEAGPTLRRMYEQMPPWGADLRDSFNNVRPVVISRRNGAEAEWGIVPVMERLFINRKCPRRPQVFHSSSALFHRAHATILHLVFVTRSER